MHVVFGAALDGRAYPEFPGGCEGALGACVVGPSGLVGILQNQLGLTGPATPPVVRIAAWQAKLEAAERAQTRFWSGSLAADPWSTARLLLSWRDALVESGWRPDVLANAPDRLADLAAAEAWGAPVPRGRADHLQEVIAAIAGGESIDIDALELVDELELLPPGWALLVRALEARGVTVTQARRATPIQADSDLGRVHRFLLDGSCAELAGDGTVVEVEASTALVAAEATAEWLAADGGAGRGTVILCPDGDSALLDRAFRRQGLPSLGISASSPYRGALQVLSLAFGVAWRPFDPQRLLELLSLPRPPIRRFAARLLASALAEEPGIGGPASERAWTEIERRLIEEAEGEDGPATSSATLKRWRAWMDVGRFDEAGIPAHDAGAICDRALLWAVELDRGNRDPLLMCVVGAARALSTALQALGRSPVSRVQIDRMIDQAVAEGLPNPGHEPHESYVRAVDNPGALWGEAQTVVWWDFKRAGTASPSFPWSRVELDALAAAGCAPEHPSDAARRQAADWQRVVLNTRAALLLVRPALNAATEAMSHPLAHRLAPVLGKGPQRDRVRFRAEQLLVRERNGIGDREIRRRAIKPTALPVPAPTWTLPDAAVFRISERTESATSFDDLISCQFKWVLKHLGRLRTGSLRQIPNTNQMFGNVAHALAQEVFLEGIVPDGRDVRRRAAVGLDDLIQKLAAPLLLPGLAGEVAFARERIPEALGVLADLLASRGLAVDGLEVERAHDFGDGLQVRSRIDLVASAASGWKAVVDLKWSGTDRRRRAEVADGRAIQLATYSRLLDPAGGVPAGYYMLNQRRLVAEAGSLLADDDLAVTRSLNDTWAAVTSSWRALTGVARSGTAIAIGVEGGAAQLPTDAVFGADKAACKFCDHKKLCRVAA